MFEFPHCPDDLMKAIDAQEGMMLKVHGQLKFCPLILTATELVVGLDIVQVCVRSYGRITLESLRISSPPFRLKRHPRPFMVCQAVSVISWSEETQLGIAKAVSIERLCRTDGVRKFDFVGDIRTLRVN